MNDRRDQIDRLLRDVDLPSLAQSYGVVLNGGGARFMGLCPFHPDTNPSLSIFVYKDHWRFKCWSTNCGKQGDTIDFVGSVEYKNQWNRRGEQFRRVLEILNREIENRPVRKPFPSTKQPTKAQITGKIQEVWDIGLKLCTEILLQNQEVMAYLQGRGYGIQEIKRWRFGFWEHPRDGSRIMKSFQALGYNKEELIASRLLRVGEWGQYEHFAGNSRQTGRIVCAEVAPNGLPRYILGRILPQEEDGRSAKYLYLPDYEKPVFGTGLVKRNRNPVYLVEGVWNMVTLDKWGLNALAIGGSMLSPKQAEILKNLKRRIIPVPDNDPAGEKALGHWQEMVPALQAPVYLLEELEGKRVKDVNDLDQIPGGKHWFLEKAQKEVSGF